MPDVHDLEETGDATGPSRALDGTVTDLEAAKLLLEAWKIRHAHSWSSLTRYFFAAAFVSVIPYVLREELASRLGGFLMAFPLLGRLIALAAVWLYAAEYIRSQRMNREFRRILKDYGYYVDVELRRIERFLLSPKIGGRPFMYSRRPRSF